MTSAVEQSQSRVMKGANGKGTREDKAAVGCCCTL